MRLEARRINEDGVHGPPGACGGSGWRLDADQSLQDACYKLPPAGRGW